MQDIFIRQALAIQAAYLIKATHRKQLAIQQGLFIARLKAQ